MKEKANLVKVELHHEAGTSFLSFRTRISWAAAGEIMKYIAQVPHIPLKARKPKKKS
jgi:hypothetical protein